MKTRYIDQIDQVFDFPSEEFSLKNDALLFHGVDMMELVEKYGTPLKIHYLPKIAENIQNAKNWFKDTMDKIGYEGDYHYCYCTKSSHFSFVLKEVLRNNAHIETSSPYDLDIVSRLIESGDLDDSKYIVCNGFKTPEYYDRIVDLVHSGTRLIPVIDNFNEAEALKTKINRPCNVGIRIASEEEPKFEFYTSRLGIGYKDVVRLWEEKIKPNENLNLKMLHFFINTGIRDNAYYWNELVKCIKLYVKLKKLAPSLDSLNIGGGFPIKENLNFDYDYQYMIEEILLQIKKACDEEGIPVPNIFTEFGTYTVGESGANLFKIIFQKKQNDRERWNMIDGSFMTALPDTWAINKRFVLLPLNKWYHSYERVLLGGLSCDSDDFYNSEQHTNAIFLPTFKQDDPLYIGFFNTGAYQENIGGFGGLQHCLIPNARHLVLNRDEEGELLIKEFAPRQSAAQMLNLLGYDDMSTEQNQ